MLEIKGLRKSFGKLVALDGVDLTVSKGETVV
ncbi:MAG TPA: amino acid ABC transporter ATP-binding protein, partial [Firmicutes bacterium]|nr:amino acid ABC transporter ATP-binding protein [Bacillota bacterium]